MTLLIVNADDFGLTEATSAAILRCHREGVVTSTSVLALAPAFERSVPMLDDHPSIGVGIHLALVGEDPPLSPPEQIPTLVDDEGRLPASWREFAGLAATGRIAIRDARRELRAQIDRVRSYGLRPTHLDSHQHLHHWPTMWRLTRELADYAEVGAIRTVAGSGIHPLSLLGSLAKVRARRSGLMTTDRFIGFRQSGHLGLESLIDELASLDGVSSAELGCHPGADSDSERVRYEWGFEWGAESVALCDPAVRQMIERQGATLATFGDLVDR